MNKDIRIQLLIFSRVVLRPPSPPLSICQEEAHSLIAPYIPSSQQQYGNTHGRLESSSGER